MYPCSKSPEQWAKQTGQYLLLSEYMCSNTVLSPHIHTIESECRDIDFTLLGSATNHTLVLYPDGPCSYSTTKRIQVIFEPCPAGFVLDGIQCICERRLLELNESNICDIESDLIGRPNDTWIKPKWDNTTENYTGFVLSHYCPLDYCNDTIKSLNFSFAASESASDAQSRENRSRTLCGECKDNYSVTLNTFHCKVCGNTYISLFIFFAFAGVLLIVILTGLQMTVAAGTINGLILYANIVSANKDTFFPPQQGPSSYHGLILILE